MRCPRCLQTDFTCVLNTVHREDGEIRRRRGCRHCQIRWTTYESIQPRTLISAFVPRPVVGGESAGPELPVGRPGIGDGDDLELGGEDVLRVEAPLHEAD